LHARRAGMSAGRIVTKDLDLAEATLDVAFHLVTAAWFARILQSVLLVGGAPAKRTQWFSLTSPRVWAASLYLAGASQLKSCKRPGHGAASCR